MIIAAGGVSPYVATPGLLGFTLFAFLGLAVFLLARSMSKHLKRIDVNGERDSDKE